MVGDVFRLVCLTAQVLGSDASLGLCLDRYAFPRGSVGTRADSGLCLDLVVFLLGSLGVAGWSRAGVVRAWSCAGGVLEKNWFPCSCVGTHVDFLQVSKLENSTVSIRH